MQYSKHQYPVLNINTKENKFDLDGKDLSEATAINISLDSSKPLGKVVIEFAAEIKFNGEVVMNEESRQELNKRLKQD